MKPYKVYVDSCSDLTPSQMEAAGLEYLQMGMSIDEKEYPADLAWGDFSPKEFYDLMRGGKRVYTIQVNEATFEKTFSTDLKEGYDILYIGCSGKLSGSVSTGTSVAERLMQANPGSKIIVIDPLISGLGEGCLGLEACRLRKEGATIEEVEIYIRDHMMEYNQEATPGNLTYLKQAGRVKASTAFFGNLIGVKPIIASDVNGYNTSYMKVRGRDTALKTLADKCVNTIIAPENQIIYITHADCETDANKLAGFVKDKIPSANVAIQPLGPILGATCGPDTIIIHWHGQRKTVGLEGNN